MYLEKEREIEMDREREREQEWVCLRWRETEEKFEGPHKTLEGNIDTVSWLSTFQSQGKNKDLLFDFSISDIFEVSKHVVISAPYAGLQAARANLKKMQCNTCKYIVYTYVQNVT